ncbi:GspE/PulE family protein [Dongshaea marina]|uniref:GspE/PulE family protein n=1 Tax=Dongshaea marina TaxID=2047966 RepID=UPI000D3E6D84|nr:ATPase, T2SS/T4P/T4SS family [Dongshaea marina]
MDISLVEMERLGWPTATRWDELHEAEKRLCSHLEINRLCRQEGSMYVSRSNTIYARDLQDPLVHTLMDRVMSELNDGTMPRLIPASAEVVEKALDEGLTDHSKQKETPLIGSDEARQREGELRALLQRAQDLRATDVHIEYRRNSQDTKTVLKCRVDGRMRSLMRPQTEEYGARLLTYLCNRNQNFRVKNFNPNGTNDGQFNLLLNNVLGKPDNTTWRYSQIDTTYGAKITLRRLASGSIPKLEDLGYEPWQIKVLRQELQKPLGVIVLSGPTGSGKTTAATSCIMEIPVDRNIHTLEDPPEYNIPHAHQTDLNKNFDSEKKQKKGEGFREYAEQELRMDPDVINIGEIRDKFAGEICAWLGNTGHLVFATLHTSSAVGCASTLIRHLGVDPMLVASPDVFNVFLNQKLIAKACPNCRVGFDDADHLSEDEQLEVMELFDDELDALRFAKPKGCPTCNGTGFYQRTVVAELILLDTQGRKYMETCQLNEWLQYLEEQGWPSIREHALLKIRRGELDFFEAKRHVQNLTAGLTTKVNYREMI